MMYTFVIIALFQLAIAGPIPGAQCEIRSFPENYFYEQPRDGLGCPANVRLCRMNVLLYGNSLKSVFTQITVQNGAVVTDGNIQLKRSCGTYVSGGYAQAIVSAGSSLSTNGGAFAWTFLTQFEQEDVLVCPGDPRPSTLISPNCTGFDQNILQIAYVDGSTIFIDVKNSMTDQTTCPFSTFCCGQDCPVGTQTTPFSITTSSIDTTTTTTTLPTTTTTTLPTTTTTTTLPTTTTTTTLPTTTTTTTLPTTTTTTTLPTTTTTTTTTTTAAPTTPVCIGQQDLYGVCNPDLSQPCCPENSRCARHAHSDTCNSTTGVIYLCIPIDE